MNFARKPEIISIFDTGKLRYIKNVVEYPTRKLISPDEVKELSLKYLSFSVKSKDKGIKFIVQRHFPF